MRLMILALIIGALLVFKGLTQEPKKHTVCPPKSSCTADWRMPDFKIIPGIDI